jgi:hypothetical protein
MAPLEQKLLTLPEQLSSHPIFDTKGVFKIRKSMKDRQHNSQKKKYKR